MRGPTEIAFIRHVGKIKQSKAPLWKINLVGLKRRDGAIRLQTL